MAYKNDLFAPFSTHAGIMIRILHCLAVWEKERPGRTITVCQIGERIGLSASCVEKAIADLKAAKWVESIRGPGGGYLLAVNLAAITVYDILFFAYDQPIKNNAFIRLSKCLALSQLLYDL